MDNPESGPLTFKILFRGQTTGDIDVGAEPSVVEEELKALSAIGPKGVTNVERFFGFFLQSHTTSNSTIPGVNEHCSPARPNGERNGQHPWRQFRRDAG